MRSNEAIGREIRALCGDVRRKLIQKFKSVHPNISEETPEGRYSDKFLKFVRYQFPDLVKKVSKKKPKIYLYIHQGLYNKIREMNESPPEASETSMSMLISDMLEDFFSLYDSVLDEFTPPTPGSEPAKTSSATVPKETKKRFIQFVQKRICLSKSEATRFILLHMYLLSRTHTSNPPHYPSKGLIPVL